MNLTKYIIEKFNQEGEIVDKIKINILTIFNTAVSTILSVQGLVSFFKLPVGSLWAYLFLVICAYSYFQAFRIWHICHFLNKIEEADEDKPCEKK